MKATVKKVEARGTFDGKYGLMYKYEISIGEHTGEYASNKYESIHSEGFPFTISKEVEYEFIDGQYPKIKQVSSGYGGGKKTGGNASFALSYAKDILVASYMTSVTDIKVITTENMFALAGKMVKWLNDN